MGLLDGAWGYLSGPMEYARDNGVEWRRKFTKLVYESGLDIALIDPTDKPIGPKEDKAYQTELQKAGKFRELQQYVSNYRRLDLRFTDSCDFLIVAIDPEIPQWGTSNEMLVGESQHKPTFFINQGGLYNLPRWLFDVIEKITSDDPEIALNESNVFTSVEDVVTELVMLNLGTKPLSNEWVLVRREVERRAEINKKRFNMRSNRGSFLC
jgi:hypothetical protein